MNAAPLITEKRYTIGKAALEGAIVACLKEYATLFPQEVVDFDREMKERRSQLHKRSGMSRDGTMMAMASVPLRLANLLKIRVSKDWMRDKWTINTVLRHFRMGQLNRSELVRVEAQTTLR